MEQGKTCHFLLYVLPEGKYTNNTVIMHFQDECLIAGLAACCMFHGEFFSAVLDMKIHEKTKNLEQKRAFT